MRSLIALLVLLAVQGCMQEQRYVVEESVLEMTEDAEPFFVDEDDNAFFRVQRRLSFPITPPPGDYDFNMGRDPAPFPRAPWVSEGDVSYQLDWAIENRTRPRDAAGRIEVVLYVDGINEFHIYEPTPPEDFHQYERRLTLAAGERASGTIRELALSEVAIDLATVVNGAPNSNLVVFPASNSRTDDRVQQYIPDLLPGLVGLRVGLLTTEAVPVELTVSVRATDHGDRIPKRGDAAWDLPDPAPFVPVVPED